MSREIRLRRNPKSPGPSLSDDGISSCKAARSDAHVRPKTVVATTGLAPVPAAHVTSRRSTCHTNSGLASASRWNIESIVIGDGSEWTSGITLKRGVLYGSAQLNGRHENFHRIVKSSLHIHKVGLRPVTFRTRQVKKKRGAAPRAVSIPSIRETRNSCRQETFVAEHLLNYMKRKKGVAVLLGGPGARSAEKEIEQYHVKHCNIIMARSCHLDCAPACLVNAIFSYIGPNKAKRAMKDLIAYSFQFKNLGQIGPVLHSLRMGMRIVRVATEHRNIQWLVKQEFGVWLVRMIVTNESDHCVAIDADRALILDSVEPYPITLCERALALCGGASQGKVIVAEVFQLVDDK